jgi:hypothetical protein
MPIWTLPILGEGGPPVVAVETRVPGCGRHLPRAEGRCDTDRVLPASPLLVSRRHVDLMRVCRMVCRLAS